MTPARAAAGPAGHAPEPQPLVIDTNIALDLLLFREPAVAPLAQWLADGRGCWLASAVMRAELAQVLAYDNLQPWLQRQALAAYDVLAAFDAGCRIVPQPAFSGVRCADPDDQPFVDLAVVHRALLLSKDHAVLRLRRRLAALGVTVARGFSLPPPA